jgi:hypothetical protein
MDVVMPKLLRSMTLSSFCVFAPGLGETECTAATNPGPAKEAFWARPQFTNPRG